MTVHSTADSLKPLLTMLDVRLREVVETFRDEIAARAADPFRGLVINDGEVDQLLQEVPGGSAAAMALPETLEEQAPRLVRLSELFGLDPFEIEALLVCLAPEIDLRYERLYAYLQD